MPARELRYRPAASSPTRREKRPGRPSGSGSTGIPYPESAPRAGASVRVYWKISTLRLFALPRQTRNRAGEGYLTPRNGGSARYRLIRRVWEGSGILVRNWYGSAESESARFDSKSFTTMDIDIERPRTVPVAFRLRSWNTNPNHPGAVIAAAPGIRDSMTLALQVPRGQSGRRHHGIGEETPARGSEFAPCSQHATPEHLQIQSAARE